MRKSPASWKASTRVGEFAGAVCDIGLLADEARQGLDALDERAGAVGCGQGEASCVVHGGAP
jgi:hypothetical protein